MTIDKEERDKDLYIDKSKKYAVELYNEIAKGNVVARFRLDKYKENIEDEELKEFIMKLESNLPSRHKITITQS